MSTKCDEIKKLSEQNNELKRLLLQCHSKSIGGLSASTFAGSREFFKDITSIVKNQYPIGSLSKHEEVGLIRRNSGYLPH